MSTAPRSLASRLAAIAGRGACTDAERRAALLVRDELRARGRPARVEPAWVRPQWAPAQAALAALGVAGSLLAVASAPAALAVLAVALVLWCGDASGWLPLVRLVLPRRATQCVVSEPPAAGPHARVRLVVAAGLDAGRTGAAYRLAGAEAAARRALRGHLPSPHAAVALALALLTALAAARAAGVEGRWLGVVAVVPTVVLVLAAAALLDVALAAPSPGANAHASALAAALALVDELDRRPPRHLAVELVAAGAADAGQLGMRAYVAARRRGARPEEIAVLALGPCGAGRPRFHVTEGQLWPLRLHQGLLAVAEATAREEPALGARPARRQVSAALPARMAGWPALGISCLDARDRPGRARTAADTAEALDPEAMRAALDFALGVVARLDEQLG